MSFTLRAKRVLALAATGALALSLFPAGIATADEHGDVCDNASSQFTDTSAPHAANIDCMFSYGVINGTSATTFDQQGSLERGQAASMLVQFAEIATDGAILDDVEGDEAPFTDITGHTHEGNIDIAYELGLVDGLPGGETYGPNQSIDRDQFASILFGAHEALGVEFEAEYDLTFDDVDENDTHAFSIAALTEEGIFSGTGVEGVFDPHGEITRGQTASVLAASARLLDELGLWEAPRLPGDEPETATDAPELIDVEVFSDDGTRTRVHYTFSDDVQPQFLDAESFYLVGWNGAQVFAELQNLRRLDEITGDDDDTNVVRAAFLKSTNGRYINANEPNAGTNQQFGTVPRGLDDIVGASVAQDAVLGLDTDLENPAKTLGIDSVSVAGDWAYAPYATELSVSSSTDEIDIEFSRTDINLVDPTDTGTAVTVYFNRNEAFNEDGDRVDIGDEAGGIRTAVTRGFSQASGDLSTSGSTLTVDLGDLSSVDASNIARVVVEPGTVESAASGQNTLQSVDYAAGANGTTPDPDLIDVSLDYGNDEATFTFSETITDTITVADTTDPEAQAERFQLHHVSAEGDEVIGASNYTAFDPYSSVIQGQSATYRPDGNLNQVTVTFPEGSVTKDVTRVSVTSQYFTEDNDNVRVADGRWEELNHDYAREAAVFASDGSGAPNPTMSLAVDQSFDMTETIGPDPVEINWEIVEVDDVDGEPQRYAINYVFDTEIVVCGEEDGTELSLRLYEEDGSYVERDCGDLNAADYNVSGNTLTVWAGNNPAIDVFQLGVAESSVLASIEFNGATTPDESSAAGTVDVVSGKPGLRNYGQSSVIVLPED